MVAVGGVAQGAQQGELAAAGEFGELGVLEGRGAEQVEGRAGAGLEGEELASEVGGRRGAQHAEAFTAQERVGVLGDEQDPATGPRLGEGGGGGDGGASGAAEAGDKDDPHAAERYRPLAAHRPGGATGPTRRASSGRRGRGR